MHGYENPWPAGGGKNKLKITAVTQTVNGVTFTVNDDGSILANGTASDDITIWLTSRNNVPLANGEYKLSGCVNGSNSTYFLAIDRGGSSTVICTNGEVAFTNDDTVTYNYPRLTVRSGAVFSNVVFQPMIRLATETDATFAPYSNICPISGHTGAEISNAAVNIWDEDWANGYYDTSGNFVSSGNYVCSKDKIMVEPDTLYYLHFPVAMTIRAYDSNQQFIGTAPGTWRNETFKPAGYFSGVRYITFNSAASGALTTYNNDISINYPATDTEYHPYTGNQISVNFPDTIYGGEDEVISGKLKSTMGMVDMGDIDWVRQTGSGVSWFAKNMSLLSKPMKLSATTNATRVLLSCYDYIGFGYAANLVNGKCITNDSLILIRDDSCATAEDFISKVTGQMLCYELAEPVEYTLTGNEMETIYGTNNIWADTGDVTVTYIAKSAKFSFGSPLHNYNYNNLKLFGNTYIEHGKG